MTGLPEYTPATTEGPLTDRPNALWQAAFLAAMVVQLVAVYSPEGVGGPHVPGIDKVIHILIFAAPALALFMAGISRRVTLWALGILALHAPVSELIQHVALPARSGDVFDVVADLGGVALAATLYVVWSHRQS
jgi:hypothetical protein